MKVFVFALAVLFAGVTAQSQDENQARFIDGIIIGMIDDLSQDLQERGLDPLVREHETFSYKLPVTDLLVVDAALENLYIEGISNIVVNHINFGILNQRLDFDITLPKISARFGSAAGTVKFFDKETGGYAAGSLEISAIRVHGRAQVRISISGGVSISSLTTNLSLGGIKSDLQVVVHEKDLSKKVNWILGEHVPNQIYAFSDEINELLAHIVKEFIEDRL